MARRTSPSVRHARHAALAWAAIVFATVYLGGQIVRWALS